jgi:hypothetical protein
VIEDALMASRLTQTDSGELVTADSPLLGLPGMEAAGAGGLTRDGVEALFQRLASRSMGTPVTATELPPQRDIAAALLFLRECMQHLGFDRISAAEG